MCVCVYVSVCVSVCLCVCFLFFSFLLLLVVVAVVVISFFLSDSFSILLFSRCFWFFSSPSLLYRLFKCLRIFTLTFLLCVSLVCVHMFIRVKTDFLNIF